MGFNIKNKKLEDYGYADSEIKRYADLKKRQILKKMIRAHKRLGRTLRAKKISEEKAQEVYAIGRFSYLDLPTRWRPLMNIMKKYSASNPEYCPIKYLSQLSASELRDAGIDDALAHLLEQMRLRIHFSYEYALHAIHPEANGY